MSFQADYLTDEERIVHALRDLYYRYGYSQFRMGKFEEYDLYARNKDFLISDRVITFTDTNGKLMALKPDVTLSIVRSCRDTEESVQRLYYDENVYRVSKTSGVYREIRQVGLECIGNINTYNIAEVVLLAMRSLMCASENAVLYISQLNILSEAIEKTGIDRKYIKQILKLIEQKNLHELTALCENNGVDKENMERLTGLLKVRETPEAMLSYLRDKRFDEEQIADLEQLVSVLNESGMAGRFNIDFSIVSDANYYNGIVFKGYIDGIPEAVISGGQYDRLMRKLGHRSCAIGFAVYMDMLERISESQKEFDTDTVLLYDDNSDVKALCAAAKKLTENGQRVLLLKNKPDKLRFRQLAKLEGSEVILLERNA